MAKYIDTYEGKVANWSSPFQRTDAFPLDRSSMFDSFEDAVKYATGSGDSRKLGATSYIGQIITVFEDDKVNAYIINAERGLDPVGSGAMSSTLEKFTIVDGKIQEATADNVGQYIYITTGEGDYTTGAYIVTGEGTVTQLTTATPGTDVGSAVSSLQGKVSTLEGKVGTVEGKVSSIETNVGTLSGNVNSLGTKVSNIETTLKSGVVSDVKVNGASITVDGVANVDLSSYATKNDIKSYDIRKADNADSGFAATYILYSNGVATTSKINIPLDQVLRSSEIKTVAEVDNPYTGALVGDKYIEFKFQNNNTPQYLPVKDLTDVYVGSDYIEVSDSNVISVKIDAVKNAVITETSNLYDGKGAAAAALTDAKDYTDERLNNFVGKEDGKGLTSNDFTDDYKGKLDNIAAGAQVNVIEKILVQGSELPITDKGVNITYADTVDVDDSEVRAIQARAVKAKFNIVNDALANKFNLEVVDALPETPSKSVVYLLKSKDGDGNVTGYSEYLYVNGGWHVIGSSLYATKELASSQNAGLMSANHYTKLEEIGPLTNDEILGILK